MGNKKSRGYIIVAVVGFVLFILGLALAISSAEPQGIVQALPFALLGIGVGAFCGGLSGVLGNRIMAKNPKLAKQKEIEVNDERNITIVNMAKAKVFDYTWFLFAAIIIFLALMQVGVWVILVLAVAFLSKIFLFICLLNKYHKEM